ncbi:hypothetical protein N7535_000261 [Penicillium sp. DV-2018c]|nr:hypothetical protein N7461_006496 [Penicillium sp. DV-2018c]KAJ5581641.1 hypothetical protein N7535_000261 [Penicillium sp. DV-2018c]
MGSITAYTPRHVNTELCFWRRPDTDRSVRIDFTKGNPENNIKQMHILDEKHSVQVQDIQRDESPYTLDKNGFVKQNIRSMLVPQETETDQGHHSTGATRTITFAHRVRCLASDPSLLADNRSPAHNVHSDFTSAGALHHLQTILPDEKERNRLLAGRALIINVWRSLKPIQRDHLAVCDWSSLDIETFRK